MIFPSAKEIWAQISVDLKMVGELTPLITPPEFWSPIVNGTLAYDTLRRVDDENTEKFQGWVSKQAPTTGKVIYVFLIPTDKITHLPSARTPENPEGDAEGYAPLGQANHFGRYAVVCVGPNAQPAHTLAHEIGHSASLKHATMGDRARHLMVAVTRINNHFHDAKRFDPSEELQLKNLLKNLTD